MKRYITTLFIAALCASCSTDEAQMPDSGYGAMRIELATNSTANITLSDDAMRSTLSTTEIPAEFIPTEDDFSLKITGSYYDYESDSYLDFEQEYDTLSAYNTAEVDEDNPSLSHPPYLRAGEYTAVMESGEGVNVESATNAHFKGELSFTIRGRDYDATGTLTATLQNSMIMLTTTPYFESYFAGGATLTLSTTQTTSITIDTTDAESYDQMLFVSPATTLYLEGSGTKQPQGNGSAESVTFTKTSIGTTSAQTLTTVVVDADDAGGKFIEVLLNDTSVEINEVDIDLN